MKYFKSLILLAFALFHLHGEPISIGSSIPNNSIVRDLNGNKTDLISQLNKKPTVLIFYRGGWCPYCNLHLSAIQEIEDEIMAQGFQIIAISPDTPEHLNHTKEINKLNYMLLLDSSMQLAEDMGIAFQVEEELVNKYKNNYNIDLEAVSGEKHHKLPHPSLFLVDTDGTIQFAYTNNDYKVRLDSKELLDTIKELNINQPKWLNSYNNLLKKYVSHTGVDYVKWSKNQQDKDTLKQITDAIGSDYAEDYSRSQKLAHYINAYNAWMIRLTLDAYPIRSVKEIGFLPFSVFKRKSIIINGSEQSLDYIEKTLLIKDIEERRIHFAVNCASRSCPPLLNEAYLATTIGMQLESAAKAFLNSEEGVRIDHNKKTIFLSSLFDWYKSDFEKKGSVIDFINNYREEKLPVNYKIRYIDYDWSLNQSQ
jgi:peroxiredoxin